MSIKANDPTIKSWVEIPKNSDFTIQNLPFGIFSTSSNSPRVGVAIGNTSVTGLVTFFNVSSSLIGSNIVPNDILSIGTEQVKVLNIVAC